nr:formyltransferase family protein [uncultured Allomuricauda sp.]
MKSIGLFLMSHKGFEALKSIIDNDLQDLLEIVVVGEDSSILNDYSDEIKMLCKEFDLNYISRKDAINLDSLQSTFFVAISWRWLIHLNKNQKLIVLHDSLLPKYRGFSPLPNSLINGETEIGVTALYASEEYDRGDIIKQSKLKIEYPIKIKIAIEKITNCYNELVLSIFRSVTLNENLTGIPQNEEQASYSLWRDEEDYNIDWNMDSDRIVRFVDAVGYPYKGALTTYENTPIRILDAEVVEDVIIENRDPGKVIFVSGNKPIVVCGKGLLKINEAFYDVGNESALPLKKFRIRFK